MANYIEPVENQTSANFIDVVSRYLGSEVFRYGDQKIITFEIYKRKAKNQSPSDRFFFIDAPHEYRPDLVSLLAYGFSEWWWQIMEANDIDDIFDFKAGRTIRIPSNVQ